MKLGTQNTEHGTRNTEHGTRNAEHGTRNTERETRNAERGTTLNYFFNFFIKYHFARLTYKQANNNNQNTYPFAHSKYFIQYKP